MIKKVLVTDPYPAEALAKIQSRLHCEIEQTSELHPKLPGLQECDALLVRSRSRVTTAILERAENLKFVASATSGRDHIDEESCQARGIEVFSAPDGNSQSAAEHTLLLMLALNRKLVDASSSLRNNNWRKGINRGHELKGKSLGIVGLGRVGSKVATLASAFEMKVFACDPYIEESAFSATGAQRLGFIELLRHSDIISFHVPLTKETKHMINRPTLEQISSHAQIINASRGSVIDENELILWLENGDLAGAALDVFAKEPLPSHSRLFNLPNVVMTPHIGALTEEAFSCAADIVTSATIEFFIGKKLDS